ncbi:hypothetical protein CsSME_00024092 [Camellia sinensis var. sinensis]
MLKHKIYLFLFFSIEDLHRRLLSTIFKKQIDGIEMLHKYVVFGLGPIKIVMDLFASFFLFWFGFARLFLEFGYHDIRIFKHIFEFLPSSTRKNVKLIKQIIHAFLAAKTFPYVLEGLRSKNNRTRIECVDLVGFLIDNHGAEGCYCEFGEKEDGTWWFYIYIYIYIYIYTIYTNII